MPNIKQNRFLTIAKTKEQIFHTDDLARIWGIKNRQTLAVTLKRYCDSGLLHRIYRGLYSLLPAQELDPIALGFKAINDYCYLGGETILSKYGAIFQGLSYYTFMGRKSRRFKIAGHDYYCRQLKDEFLFNSAGINNGNEASPERAAADIFHLNRRYHLDNPSVLDWDKLRGIQKAVYDDNI